MSDPYPATAPVGPASVARHERSRLCDLFDEVGPNAPTLCAGWESKDLVVHLLRREGTPADAVRLALRAVRHESPIRQDSSADFSALVARLRTGPPLLSLFGLPLADDLLDTLEFYVHHEDLRRAAADWQPRSLPTWVEDKLWRLLSLPARAAMRRSPVGVTLQRSDDGRRLTPVRKPASVTVRGLPSEATLFAFGRRSVAQVEVTGDPSAIAALADAQLGV
ncbi:MAG: TIGR03085 family metal-binding protein [Sciscionella sp.]